MENSTKKIIKGEDIYMVSFYYAEKKGVISNIVITEVKDNSGYIYNLGVLRSRGILSEFLFRIEADYKTQQNITTI